MHKHGPYYIESPIFLLLEQSGYLSGFHIYIHPSKGRVGACARHETDSAGARAEEFSTRVDEYVTDRQGPPFGDTL